MLVKKPRNLQLPFLVVSFLALVTWALVAEFKADRQWASREPNSLANLTSQKVIDLTGRNTFSGSDIKGQADLQLTKEGTLAGVRFKGNLGNKIRNVMIEDINKLESITVIDNSIIRDVIQLKALEKIDVKNGGKMQIIYKTNCPWIGGCSLGTADVTILRDPRGAWIFYDTRRAVPLRAIHIVAGHRGVEKFLLVGEQDTLPLQLIRSESHWSQMLF